MVVNAVALQFDALNARLNQALNQCPPMLQPMESVVFEQPGVELRMNGGVFFHLPNDYEFPKVGVYDLWIKWSIRDTMRHIPLLKTLHNKIYKLFDSKP